MANFFGNVSAERQAQIAAVWQSPTMPETVQPLEQDLQEGKVSIHKETVNVSKLWEVPQEALRGHALKWVLIEAQKITKRSIALRAKAQEDGKELPPLVTVQEAFDWLCENGLQQTVQGVTPSADGQTRATKAVDPVSAVQKATGEASEEEKIDFMLKTGLITEATADVLRKQIGKGKGL